MLHTSMFSFSVRLQQISPEPKYDMRYAMSGHGSRRELDRERYSGILSHLETQMY